MSGYSRTTWEEGVTSLSAQNMNNIEDGVEEALATADSALTKADRNEDAIEQVYTKAQSDARYRTKSEIEKYNGSFGSWVDLLANKWPSTQIPAVNYNYTAPSDGYVTVTRTVGASSSSTVRVYINATSTSTTGRPVIEATPDTGDDVSTLFVKKGTSLFITAMVPTQSYKGDVFARFFPYATV